MRLFEFENDRVNDEKLVDFIKEKCQPYISQNPELIPMYRGTKYNGNSFIISPPVNRKPRDSYRKFQSFMNEILNKSGMIANRSNSIFVTGNYFISIGYGTPYVVFPIGEFSFTWSTLIDDATTFFLFDIFNKKKKLPPLFINKPTDKESVTHFLKYKPKDYQLNPEAMDVIVNSYSNKDLVSAIKSHHEIMLTGANCLMIPAERWDVISKHLRQN